MNHPEQVTVQVSTKAEHAAIQRALDDPEAKALVTIIGILMPLSKRRQANMMRFVAEELAIREEEGE